MGRETESASSGNAIADAPVTNADRPGEISEAADSSHHFVVYGAPSDRSVSGGGLASSDLPPPDRSELNSASSSRGRPRSRGGLFRGVLSKKKYDANPADEETYSDFPTEDVTAIEDDGEHLFAQEDDAEQLDAGYLHDEEEGVSDNPPSNIAPTHLEATVREGQWSDDFFDESFFSTIPYAKPTSTEVEIRFVEECLELKRDSRVLDLGCGWGRHAIGLAERGYQVLGLDSSADMVKKAEAKSMAMNLNVEFIHFDMRDMRFEEEFDSAYCVNTSFGFYDDDTNQKIIDVICRSLIPGGRFLLEVVNRDYVIDALPARVFWSSRECVVSEETDFDYMTCRLNSDRALVFDDGAQICKNISMRLYSAHELAKMLYSAGFDLLEISGHYAHRSRFFGSQSRSLIVLAERV